MIVKINLNACVRVRLTDRGRDIMRANWERLLPHMPYRPRAEIDGWSKWMLWDLMRELGEHVVFNLPFETDIEFVARTE